MIVDEDVYLEHYGKKGMKWGERKAAFQTNRKLNKESKEKQKIKEAKEFDKLRASLRPSTKPVKPSSGKNGARDARRADIDRARERVNSGALRADGKSAKTQYKKDKANMGSREARKILRSKRSALYADQLRSEEIRDGGEMAAHIINTMARTMQENANARRMEATRTAPRARYG